MTASPDRPVAVITGASSGIGRATARECSRRGMQVVVAARRPDALNETVQACAGNARAVECDVRDRASVAALAQSVREVEGRCDLLVVNAGIGARSAFDGPHAIDVFEAVIATNLTGAAACIGELLPLLRESTPASIVTVSSVAGTYGLPGAPSYCASKFGLSGFSEALHVSLAHLGVRVACVHPGPVPTPGWPQRWLAERWYTRWLTASDERTARAILRAARPHRNPRSYVPWFYRLPQLLRVGAPPLWRWAMRHVARRLPIG
jgi:NAD(P)-dependent dehydrogenase (short-subunit alcohol dehydrogenase family)